MKPYTLAVVVLTLALCGCAAIQGLFTPAVETPVFSPAGGTYTAAQSVTVTCATSGASILYTVDGSDPTASSGTAYSSAITVSSTTTIKALATKVGMTDSPVAAATYTMNIPQVATPVIEPVPGTYYINFFVLKTRITCATDGATIVYTIDGTAPSKTNGTVWSTASGDFQTFPEQNLVRMQAMAYKDGLLDSAVVASGVVIAPRSNSGLFLYADITVSISEIYMRLSSQSDWGVNQIYAYPCSFGPGDYFPISYLRPGSMDMKVVSPSGSYVRTFLNIPLLDGAHTEVHMR
jgi:hypothetical protein